MNRTDSCPSEADLRRMLRAAYGPALAPTGDGFAVRLETPGPSTSFRIRLANDQLVVVRAAPGPHAALFTHELDLLSSEVEALQVIAEHTGVPVPAMHHHDDSHGLVDVEWFCREFLPGRPLAQATQLTGEELAALRRDLDDAARALHTITGDGFGRFLQPTLDSWQDAFSGLVEDALADGQRLGLDLGIAPDRVHAAFLAHCAALDEVTAPVFCPWAFGVDDVVVDDDGRLAGLVQPDRVFWADPLLEAGQLGSTAPVSPAGQTRRLLYRLYANLVGALEDARAAALPVSMAPPGRRPDLAAAVSALEGHRPG